MSSQLTDMMRLDDFNRHISSGCDCAFSAAECAVGQHFGTPPLPQMSVNPLIPEITVNLLCSNVAFLPLREKNTNLLRVTTVP